LEKKLFMLSAWLKKNNLIGLFIVLATLSAIARCKKDSNNSPNSNNGAGINKINHVVIIYLENHSFDNLYGQFTGANGLASASASNTTQLDASGNPFKTLPPAPNSPKFPTKLPNTYFNIDQYVPSNIDIPDLVHSFYEEQQQIDGGKMDKFALIDGSKGMTMGYYNTNLLPLKAEATKYTLCDNFYHSAFGGSLLNHIWLIAAASPVFPNAPASIVASLGGSGYVIKNGVVTPDGFVVNDSFTVNAPHPAGVSASTLIPNQTMPTIGDRLSAKNISWVWFSGGWDNALAGHADASFQFHHQPFAYFANYADGTKAKADHLKDETYFMTAAQNGTLPAVSFVKPLGINNEHPAYTNVQTGENHAIQLINAVRNGPNWNDTAIIITYDENGGFWDHASPPSIDKWGPGTRIPAIIISPFAKKGYIDHTQYETVSILSFIEKRWQLAPLTDRDKNANPLSNAFNF
jgi:phospholipase C